MLMLLHTDTYLVQTALSAQTSASLMTLVFISWYMSICRNYKYCTVYLYIHKVKVSVGTRLVLLKGQLLAVCRHHLLRLVPLAAGLET